MKNKIQTIQNLRGFAALVVLIHHVFLDTRVYIDDSYLISHFYNLEYFGNIGVDMFFVISGFIMVLIHGNDFMKPKAIRIFFLKRIIRVVPLYWILTFLAGLMLYLFPSLFGAGKVFDVYHTIASFFFIPWSNSAGMTIPILAAGWTLNYEMYFYLVFAFFLLFSKKFFLTGISLYFILSMALGYFDPTLPYFKMLTNPLLIEFLLGVYIGILYNKKILVNNKLLLIVSIILFFSNIFFQSDIEYRLMYFGIPSALLVYILLSFEYFKGIPLCGNKILGFLGTISYSLYLSHVFIYKAIIKIYPKFFGIQGIDFMILLAIIASIFGAVVVYNFIEKPITQYHTNKFSSKALS